MIDTIVIYHSGNVEKSQTTHLNIVIWKRHVDFSSPSSSSQIHVNILVLNLENPIP